MTPRLRTYLVVNAALFVLLYPLLLWWLWAGGPDISRNGFLAAVVGIAATWIVGVALMGLLFASDPPDDGPHRM
jgi:hypothetical protein